MMGSGNILWWVLEKMQVFSLYINAIKNIYDGAIMTVGALGGQSHSLLPPALSDLNVTFF